MPYVALSSAIIYIINSFFAFLFCCQVNFDRELEMDGNDWLQKITQPNFDLAKSKEAKEKQKQKKEAKLQRQKAKAKQAKNHKAKSRSGVGTLLYIVAFSPSQVQDV